MAKKPDVCAVVKRPDGSLHMMMCSQSYSTPLTYRQAIEKMHDYHLAESDRLRQTMKAIDELPDQGEKK